MKNRFAAAIATTVLAAIAFGSCTSERPLRLVSYNVDNCTGTDSIRNIQRIADVIAAQNADVVALQGLDSMTLRAPEYTLGQLAAMTGLHPTYGPAVNLGGDGGSTGVGILSKDAPLSTRLVPLRGAEQGNALLVAEFKRYYFISAAFARPLGDQITSTATLKELAASLDKPTFLGGSLNARYGSQAISSLVRDFTPLVDLSARTWPADEPTILVDYLFMYNRRLRSFTIGTLSVVDEAVASTHRPVTADVSFR